jgi:hypothetical protein
MQSSPAHRRFDPSTLPQYPNKKRSSIPGQCARVLAMFTSSITSASHSGSVVVQAYHCSLFFVTFCNETLTNGLNRWQGEEDRQQTKAVLLALSLTHYLPSAPCNQGSCYLNPSVAGSPPTIPVVARGTDWEVDLPLLPNRKYGSIKYINLKAPTYYSCCVLRGQWEEGAVS